MARIIYGVQGEGRGHGSRSKLVIEHLMAAGHEVRIFTSNKGLDYLSQYFENVTPILGLGFVFDGHRLDLLRTVQRNIQEGSGEAGRTVSTLARCVREFKPQVAITDFEPFVPYVHSLGVPFLSINHQHILTHYRLEFPHAWRADYRAARAVTDNMYRRAKRYFVTSFFFPPVKNPYRRRAVLVGPILRREVLDQTPSSHGPIVLYATTAGARQMLDLARQTQETYLAYGFDEPTGPQGNITFRPPSTDGFLRDVAAAKAVIANGGYTLMSEALYLRTPIYSIPIDHQFEQMLNGYYLQKLGYGLYDLEPTLERLTMFLDGLGYFVRNIERDHAGFCGNHELFERLDGDIKDLARPHRQAR